jgi:hypothetical protein
METGGFAYRYHEKICWLGRRYVMYRTMRSFGRVLVFGVMFIMPMFIAANRASAMDMEARHEMSSHHQHMMLNHALGMTLEGYNLVMLANMGMATGVDAMSVEHGNMMIKNGTALYNEIMSGETMMGMHQKGKDPMKDPAMAYTHKLAEKQLIVMDLLSRMPRMGTGTDMVGHHQHIMLNHALQMALEGSNSFMLGQMGMAKGVDEISVEHGKMMLKNARDLFNDIMSGGEMNKMHMEGTTPESDELMKYTHKLAEAQLQVLTLLDEMPGIK